jgi:hypothetical protein
MNRKGRLRLSAPPGGCHCAVRQDVGCVRGELRSADARRDSDSTFK